MDYKEIDTFEKVLEANGLTMEQFQNRTIKMAPDTCGYEKIKLIVLAMNEGKNVSTGYCPYFYNPNRSAVDFECSEHECIDNNISSRILIVNLERAIFAGKTFPKEYSEFING